MGLLQAASPLRQHDLESDVWLAIEAAGGRRWRKGDERAGSWRLLVGIATYSKYDLELAEWLLALPRDPGRMIELFSVMDVRHMEEFEDYIPGIGNVWGTPVVGFWKEGELQEAAYGFAARQLVRRLCSD